MSVLIDPILTFALESSVRKKTIRTLIRRVISRKRRVRFIR